jgi:hypothetical protein
MVTLIEDGDGVPVVDEGRQLPQAVLRHQGQVVDAYQPTCQICQYVIKKGKDHGRRNFKDSNPIMSSSLVILFGVVKQFGRF